MQELFLSKIIDLRILLREYFVGITEAVKKEFVHYEIVNFLPLSDLIIIPIDESDFEKKIIQYPDILELDTADQTLWYLGYSNKQSEFLILTDDGELFSECYISQIPAFRLPDFLLMLLKNTKIKKNVVAKSLKFWSYQKRYSKKDLKNWKKILQSIE